MHFCSLMPWQQILPTFYGWEGGEYYILIFLFVSRGFSKDCRYMTIKLHLNLLPYQFFEWDVQWITIVQQMLKELTCQYFLYQRFGDWIWFWMDCSFHDAAISNFRVTYIHALNINKHYSYYINIYNHLTIYKVICLWIHILAFSIIWRTFCFGMVYEHFASANNLVSEVF